MKPPSRSQIALLAYQLYLEDGKPEGQADSHWHRAVEILTHPETYSDDNVLSPPSEPEVDRALDARAEVLDAGLPSDPHSGREAYHQRIEVGVNARDKKAVGRIRETLRCIRGIEKVQAKNGGETVQISFDARRTNPAAIHAALSGEEPSEPEAELE